MQCAAALVHWGLDMGGATPVLKRRSLFERCLKLPVGAWSVACKKYPFTVSGQVLQSHNFVLPARGNCVCRQRNSYYGWTRSSLCLLFLKLPRLCVFSSFIQPITYARASREHAFDASLNKTAIYSRNPSSLCFLVVKLALLFVFSLLRPAGSDPRVGDGLVWNS